MPLDSGLKNQRVLVTAASQGIGFGVAKALLEEGARVAINSSNEERLSRAKDKLSGLGEVRAVPADISERTGIEHVVSESARMLGGIDLLAYSTGSPARGLFMEKGYDEWEGAAKLLTVGPAYLARKVADVMIANKTRGRMVFSSSYAIREPIPNIALSNVCRIAILGIVRTLARELGPKGIRVNGIMPGRIMTSRIEDMAMQVSKSKGISMTEALKDLETDIPLRRIGSAEEMANAFIFLGSDLSSYVTGAMLPVDGGLLRSIA